MDMKQKPRATLKQYLERFMAELSLIENPDNLIASRIYRDKLTKD